jgi:hypothetical protein
MGLMIGPLIMAKSRASQAENKNRLEPIHGKSGRQGGNSLRRRFSTTETLSCTKDLVN